MTEFTQLVLNPYAGLYLISILGVQLLYRAWRRQQGKRTATQRRTRGLPAETLLNRPYRRGQPRRQALSEGILLFGSVLVLPFLVGLLSRLIEGPRLPHSLLSKVLRSQLSPPSSYCLLAWPQSLEPSLAAGPTKV